MMLNKSSSPAIIFLGKLVVTYFDLFKEQGEVEGLELKKEEDKRKKKGKKNKKEEKIKGNLM